MADAGLRIVERLHQGRSCSISRALRSDGSAVIVKQRSRRLSSADEVARLEQEYELLRTLEVPGVAKALEYIQLDGGPAIVFEDLGGVSLRRLRESGARPWHDWLDIAVASARLLGRLHEARIVHLQVNPDHLLVNPANGTVQLVDFACCLRPGAARANWDPAHLAAAHLPYMAPEQTGRINRVIDYRSDYYSFGATLYELLAGRPPFGSADALELAHCHIARPPEPPQAVDPAVPEVLGAVVLKLLAKDAAERYQSSAGLVFDLERILAQERRQGRVEPFALATRDASERFEIPRRLYGREEILHRLAAACDACAAGSQILVLISGDNGVGKSALVHACRAQVVERGGRFVSGKFDQYRRNRPYFAVIQGFQGLVRELLTEPERSIAAWRARLLDTLGGDVAALLRLIPEFEPILGGTAAPGGQPPQDERNRFRLFRRLFTVFADAGRPLAFFLDDLQWSDPASLQLLESLALTGTLPGLLLIGSYRDDELHAGDALTSTLLRLRRKPLALQEHRLTPLTVRQVGRLLADTLRCSLDDSRALAAICHQKTQGNPFVLQQFLTALHDEGLIRWRAGRWQWDEAAIRARELGADVVALMVGKIRRLPLATQKVLPVAACVGAAFDLRILAVACRNTPQRTAQALWPAIADGLVAPVDERYRLLEPAAAEWARYRFVHDRIQQAAFSLVDEGERAALHLVIGRQLLQSLAPDEIGPRVFEIANHLNPARALIESIDERLQLAALNLEAGTRAREAGAFDGALDYLCTGLGLLPADGWERRYRLALDLHTAAAEVAGITMDFGLMEALGRTIDERARTLLDKVRMYELRIRFEVARNRFPEALETALQVLALLGIVLPAHPSRLQTWLGLRRARRLLRRLPGDAVLELPPMRSPRVLAALPILGSLFGVIKFSSSSLRPLVFATQVELTVRHGLADHSAPAFVGFGSVLCSLADGDGIDEGYRIGRLGMKIDERRPAPATRHKTRTLFNSYVRHFREPLRCCLDGLMEAHRLALEAADMEYAAYSLAGFIQYSFPLAPALPALQAEMQKHVDTLRRTGQKQSLQYSMMALQTVANLRGQNADPLRLDGDFYAEEAMLAEHRRENHRTAICVHHFYKALLALLFDDAAAACRECEHGIAYLPYVGGTFTAAWFPGLQALAILAAHRPGRPPPSRAAIATVRRALRLTRNWARHAEANHVHRAALIEAELMRVEGHAPAATDLYERAIRLADAGGFVLEAAMACEASARFHFNGGRTLIARGCLDEACRRYREWGATAKLAQLRDRDGTQSGFLGGEEGGNEAPVEAEVLGGGRDEAPLSERAFDLASVIKASQAISDEIVLERLLGRLMHLALAHAGAQRGLMVLSRQGRLFIEAEAVLDLPPRFFAALPLEDGGEHLPVSVCHYAARTREAVVLGDGAEPPLFERDPYLLARQPRSLLCLPIVYHGELTALLYLEHAGSRNVFDRQRLEMLRILSAQAAISIENAKLYQSLQQSEGEYRSLFEHAVEGIFRLDPQGRFLSANPALASLLGYPSSEAFLASATDLSRQCFIDGEDLRRFLDTLQQRDRVLNFETRWQRRDGEAIDVSVSARRVLDADDRLLFYEGSLTDIGERKAKEQAERARETAEAASAAKSGFLATMSHEIRTPLNGILGMAQLLMRSGLAAEQQARVQAIYRSGRSLLAILNDVLDFSKIEAGQLTLESGPFSPAAAVAELLPLLQPIADEKGLRLVADADPRLPRCVLGDRRALDQVLLNLATNALKFTPAGQVAIRVRRLGEAVDSVWLRFEVEDTGIGIAADARERVFDHFSQADSSITRRFGGSGLGLAICRRLVLLQGGRIGVDSTPGIGSRFWFELGYAESDAVPPALPVAPASALPGRALDVLLVEDTEINQLVTRGLLEGDGHRVAVAADGHAALALHEAHDFDLVLMDIHLPGMDGLETTRRMRAHADPRKAGVRIVALTAAVTAADADACLAAGIEAVLGKPLQFEALQRLLVGAALEAVPEAGPPAGSGAGAGEGEGEGEREAALLDTALLDQHRELLGADSFAALIPTLSAQCRALLDELRSERLPERQQQLLHRLAGACHNFGLGAAAARCQALEGAAAGGRPLTGLPALEALLAASLERLAAYRGESAAQRA